MEAYEAAESQEKATSGKFVQILCYYLFLSVFLIHIKTFTLTNNDKYLNTGIMSPICANEISHSFILRTRKHTSL